MVLQDNVQSGVVFVVGAVVKQEAHPTKHHQTI